MSAETFDDEMLAELRRQVAEASGARLEDVTREQIDAYVEAALAAEEELSDSTLHARFEQRVARSLDSQGVIRGIEVWRAAELDERANRLARWLTARGVSAGDIVPLCMARSRLSVVAILGVLKAGAAYLLLDPGDPTLALAAELDLAMATARDGAAPLLLTDATTERVARDAALSSQAQAAVLSLHALAAEIAEHEGTSPGPLGGPDSVAYACFSAGRLVLVDHRGALGRIAWLQDALPLGADTALLYTSPRATDGHVRDVLWPLLFGAPLVLPASDETESLARAIPAHRVAAMHLCPSALARLLESTAEGALESLRFVMTGGELAPARALAELRKKLPCPLVFLHNMPEAVSTVAFFEVEPDDAREAVVIGNPAACAVYVLDRYTQPVPIGVSGELFIGSEELALGYAGDAEATAASFLKSPFDDHPRAQLFRTGERGRRASDGSIEVARSTERSWIEGHRVDARLIEAALGDGPEIAACAVLLRDAGGLAPEVVAYVTPRGAYSEQALAKLAEARLPPSMRPSTYVRVARLPLSADGAIDVAALAAAPVVDGDLASRWERALGALPEVTAVAAVARDYAEHPEALHLSDLVPHWKALMATGAAKAPVVEGASRSDSAGKGAPSVSSGGQFVLPEGAPQTLSEALLRAAAREDKGLVFIDLSGAERRIPYAGLLEKARRVLSGLGRLGLLPGDKVLFQLAENEDIVTAYWACILGGLIAVPVGVAPSYVEPNATLQKLQNAWRMLDRPIVVTTASLAADVSGASETLGLERFKVVTIEALAESPADETAHVRGPSDIAVLLLTSGSTGMPKGVPLTDANILNRSFSMAAFLGMSSEITLNWMPLDHVVGLVMFHTRDVVLCHEQIHAATPVVLKDPLTWLDWIERFKVTLTWAPNFAFGLVNQHATRIENGSWDLSSVRIIQNGGEAVVAKTARRFLAQLAPHKLSGACMFPGWGMSETSSAVAFALDFRLDGTSDGDSFVDLGRPIPGFSMRIVDVADQVVDEGTIGRLQVKGLSVTSGYYQASALNAEAFTQDGWFDTGDLGLLAEGRLTLTGREKDVIIVNGINYNNHEIESVVEEIDGVVPSFAAACAVRRPGGETDDLAVFFVAESETQAAAIALGAEIRERVAKSLGIAPAYVIPVSRDAIPKTSIGKIQRSALGRAFAKGDFDAVVRAFDIATENESTLPAWFYRRAWVRREAPPANPRGIESVLVFSGRAGLGQGLSALLREEGCRVTTVLSGSAFAELGEGLYQIDPTSFDDHERVVAAAAEGGGLSHAIHLWTAGAPKTRGVEATVAAQDEGVFSVLALHRALSRATGDQEARPGLLVASRGTAVATEADMPCAARFPLIGLLHTIAAEAPSARVRLVDIGGDEDAAAAGLMAELSFAEDDVEVAYRQGQRLVARVSALDMSRGVRREVDIQRGGVYLAAGGLGGVGSAVCERLLAHFGIKLVLVGKTELPDRADFRSVDPKSPLGKRIERLLALEKAGGEVVYEAADISDRARLAEVVLAAEQCFGQKLAGILHMAGEGDIASHFSSIGERLLSAETREGFDLYFRTKLRGTMTLFELIENKPDAAFIAFSSVNGVFGGATFGAYSAASSFIDGFCAEKRAKGHRRVRSFNWTMWDDVGMNEGAPEAAKEGSRSLGYHLISPSQGYFSLLTGLAREEGALLVGLDAESPALRRRETNGSLRATALSAGVVARGGAVPTAAGLSVSDRFGTPSECASFQVSELPKAPSGEVDRDELARLLGRAGQGKVDKVAPRNEIERRVATIFREVLATDSVSVFDNFFELGGHSLRATQVIARLRDAFDIELPLARLFEGPTVAALAEAIAARQGAPAASHLEPPPILPMVREGEVRLSFAQERLWFLDQLEPNSPFYNISGAVSLAGALDLAALEKSVQEIVRRHEVLRTTLRVIDRDPVQVIHPSLSVPIPVVDWALVPEEAREDAIRVEVMAEAQRPFSLADGPLIRLLLIRLDETSHVLVLTMHHAVSDGWSIGVFVREVAALYEAFSRGAESPLAPLSIQYADFAIWQRQWLSRDFMKDQLEYWKAALDGAPKTLDLPTDRPRPAVQTFRGSRRPFSLSSALSASIRELSRREDVTLFMTLVAAFDVLLSRLSGQDDFVIGTPIASRHYAKTEELIGFFLNTVVLRADLRGEPTFRELLARVRAASLEAYAHQDLPFERLVNEIGAERDLSRTPLFQVMFVLQNAPMPPLELSGLVLAPIEADPGTSQFDCLLSIEDVEGALTGSLQYNTDLFDEASIDRMIEAFVTLLEGAVLDPSRRVFELPIVPAADRRLLLETWNDTARAYPEGESLRSLFEAQVDKTPDAVALVFEDERLTYRELDVRANKLAHVLRARGVGPDVLVAVCMERSIELLVALYGVVKAGGAYVPVDPSYPKPRIAFFLEDAAAPVLLTQAALAAELPASSAEVFCLDSQWAEVEQASAERPTWAIAGEDLAYMIYTSGSTGQPKGAMNAHAGIVNRLFWMQEAFGLDASDAVLQKTPFSFDVSVWELFWPLMTGAKLVIARPEGHKDPAYLTEVMQAHSITTTHFVPSMLRAFLDFGGAPGATSLKRVICSGEALTRDLCDRFFELFSAELHNLYGPTEAAIDVTWWACERGSTRPIVPIGKAIANTQIYVLDPHLSPTPIGAPGELWIGGVQLARGYHKRPELTAERFVDVTVSGAVKRLYRTGDLARFLPDGNVEYLRRIDTQVKLRGFRIELGEIDAALAAHPGVRAAVVALREDAPGEKRLVAYVVPNDEAVADADLRAHLRASLPDYMVPSAFVAMETLPLTSSGKIDRRALPKPDAIAASDREHIAPRTPMEELLAGIFGSVLRRDKVSVVDSFFELGGDSILSIQVVSRAKEAGITLSPKQIFQHQSVADLAESIGETTAKLCEQGPITGDCPLTPVQTWFFETPRAAPQHYNQALLLDVSAPLDEARLASAFEALIAHHDALRLRFSIADGTVTQHFAPIEGGAPLSRVDLTSLPEAEWPEAVLRAASEAQASLDLGSGPLLRAVLFDRGREASQRLFVAIHHLAVDGVSWRILLDDLWVAYRATAIEGGAFLPEKTTSYKAWAERLVVYAKSPEVEADLATWVDLDKEVAPLPVDHEGGDNTVASVETIVRTLDEEETQQLLGEAQKAYNTEVSDLLLAAVFRGLSHFAGSDRVRVALEGHGREEFAEDLDVTRTVGWFTTVYPACIEVGLDAADGETIKSVKEQLRAIPKKGMSFGLLRYLGSESARETLAAMPEPELLFNYLGQLDQGLPESSPLRLAEGATGSPHAPGDKRRYLLDLGVSVTGGCLTMTWLYSKAIHDRETMDDLADRTASALSDLIAHCLSPEAGGYTPSDFKRVKLRADVLDSIVAKLSDKGAGK